MEVAEVDADADDEDAVEDQVSHFDQPTSICISPTTSIIHVVSLPNIPAACICSCNLISLSTS